MPSFTMPLIDTAAALATIVGTHPGHDIRAEAIERSKYIKRSTNLYTKCGKNLEARGYGQRAIRPIPEARSFDDVLNTDHHSNVTGIDLSIDQDTVFSDNSSCMLQPEITEGLYCMSAMLAELSQY
ncbi:MAG: hypothetical protein MMC23_005911 [Stictis urceolatum]|nr:hypothetical protein [Stictis urceolata]